MTKDEISRLWARALEVMPGGVNSPVRSWKSVGGRPFIVKRGRGCRLEDENGRIYIDYVCSWGPLIAGHAPAEVLEEVRNALALGTSYGIPCSREIQLAEKVVAHLPSVEMVRMVNSGTEATMSAIRLARAITGRPKVIKFEGCYHGHSDGLLVKSGSGVLTLGIPGTPGVPDEVVVHTLSAAYNDEPSVQRIMAEMGNEVACIIVEPVAGNMGTIPPEPGFLETLRELCDQWGSLLIFDEVITGFRLGLGGGQERFGVMPDLTCLGKIIGGGFPVGAYGGGRSLMTRVAPEGDVYQAGTLSGNPLAMAAGLAVLEILETEGCYERLEEKAAYLEQGFKDAAFRAGVPVTVNRVGSMGSLFFREGPVRNFDEVTQSDTGAYAVFFNSMLRQGVYMAPSAFECFFVSLAHDQGALHHTVEASRRAMVEVARFLDGEP